MRRSVVLALGLSGGIMVPGAASAQDTCPSTTPEENADLVQRFIETVYIGHNPQALPNFYAEDFNRTNPARPHRNEPGLDDDIARVERSLREFPDMGAVIDEVIADENRVVLLLSYTGTQQGALEGWDTPATGRHASWNAVQVIRIECGKIVENIVVADRFSMFRQLGVISDEELQSVHEVVPR